MLKLAAFDLEVTYKSGKKMFIAYILSRAALSTFVDEQIEEEINLCCNLLIASLSVNELTIVDNLIYKCNSLVIPTSLRKDILSRVHEGHLGIARCKNLARNSVFWPSMNNDIQNVVSNCEICIRYRKSNQRQPIIPHEIEAIPWYKVGIDIFDYNKQKYLLVVDYYSTYIEIALLNTGFTAKRIIHHLKSIFARHGIPKVMISDNGPPFNSKEFKEFSISWDIDHNTSSPYYPRSNGLAERSIGTIKTLLQKSNDSKTDPYIALLQHRTTAKNGCLSPAELLMSRKLRTKLPTLRDALKPNTIDAKIFKDNEGNTYRRNREHLLETPCSGIPKNFDNDKNNEEVFSSPEREEAELEKEWMEKCATENKDKAEIFADH
ncbi:uncharacterized protein K02A2.6-like [Condylostylus longicornis]|uniref:uncharacterized protein K02A2.6-like n=1 Tax=Condylostylus longicornis TaxID=2530218 RepID=UPI00244E0A6C|nr:uncharacterized protein K02A2.6-like [Condylostylus longicornis]